MVVNINGRTAVLMLTCKKFEQAWDPFFTLFKKYWPDCPYQIIMGTDTGQYPGIKVVEVGEDLGWADNAIYILEKLDLDRVILFLEDYMISEEMDDARIQELVKHAFDYDIGCLRLNPCPGPTAKWKHSKKLGKIGRFDSYRLSLQVALWKKDLLLDLLEHGESPWETEIRGTIRSSKSREHFVSVHRGEAPLSYYIAIRKNVWQQDALDLLKKENISIDKIDRIIK